MIDLKKVTKAITESGHKAEFVNENEISLDGKTVRFASDLVAIGGKRYRVTNVAELITQLWSKRVLNIQSSQIDDIVKKYETLK
ncbi:MAG: hypothetical protein WC389_18605 [Lutibacter sp.]|jgi:hypothetical protein